MRRYKLKLCLFGGGGVGKTSLIRRYVYDEFDDKYLQTIGTKVSKKVVDVFINGEDVEVQLYIWDIMGQKNYRDALKEAYFHGADALLGVADITRKETLEELEEWMEAMRGVVKDGAPVIFLGNKWDLKEEAQFGREEIELVADRYLGDYYFTSAKTGEHVEEAFEKLAERAVEKRMGD